MKEVPRISAMGERGILIEFEPGIREEILEHILCVVANIESHYLKASVEVINTYDSILINYIEGIENIYDEITTVEKDVAGRNIQVNFEKKIFRIPVCYSDPFALDLAVLADRKKCSKEEIIHRHTKPLYTVYFIGFLPGFLYLGGLDQGLYFPRKREPRLRVEKGAVGIGGRQTGIYPNNSPGGWQIIGNSPVPLFQVDSMPPCAISPGDKVQFYPIGIEEHARILQEVKAGGFRIEEQKYDG